MVKQMALGQTIAQAKRLNDQNNKLRENLKELFPELEEKIFMNVLSEEEIPEDMTYLVVETDDYSVTDPKTKSARENVAVTLWSTNRQDPTLDHLYVILAGQEAGLRFTSTTNDYVVMPDNKTIVNMFVVTFARAVKVGC